MQKLFLTCPFDRLHYHQMETKSIGNGINCYLSCQARIDLSIHSSKYNFQEHVGKRSELEVAFQTLSGQVSRTL